MTQEKAMNMSNEQAIKLLQSMMLMMCDQHGCPVSDVYFALERAVEALKGVPPAEPERLTDEDFETIRIHLNAYKEQLCNQHRWEEAEEYQRIIDRFMAFASAEPERKKGKWIEDTFCSECGWIHEVESGFIGSVKQFNYCPNCGARMENGNE